MLDDKLNLFLSISSFVIGILGLVSGTVFYLKGKSKKKLEYQVTSTNLISKDIAAIPNLKVIVADEPTSDLISTTIVFMNKGNTTIHSSDIASKLPIQILTSGHFFNAKDINSKYIQSDNINLNQSISVIDENKIIVGFEYLEPKETFSITIWHDGEIDVQGNVKGGKFQPYSPPIMESQAERSPESNFVKRFLQFAFVILTCTVVSFSVSTFRYKQELVEENYRMLALLDSAYSSKAFTFEVIDKLYRMLDEYREFVHVLQSKQGIELSTDFLSTVGATDGIIQLLVNYSDIAEYPIATITSGDRDYDNWVQVNGISIHIIDTEKSMTINYDWEGQDDSAIVPVMRDFCKALVPSLTNEDFSIALDQLRSEEYQYFDTYTFSGIEGTYITTPLETGETRYTIETGYSGYQG